MKKFITIAFFAAMLCSGWQTEQAHAANVCQSNGTGGGNFNVSSTWTSCGATTPQTTDSITILNGDTVTLVATTNVAGITINNGGILGANTRALTDTGNYTDNGQQTGTTSAMTLSGSGTTIGGSGSYSPTGVVTISTGAKTITASSSLTFGSLTVTGVTVTNNSTAGFTVSTALAGAGTLAQGSGGILNLGGAATITTLNASVSINSVYYTSASANQTVHGGTYSNLFVNKLGTTGTLGGAITVNNNITVMAGTLADGGFQITGNATGIFTLSSGATLTLGTVATATSFPTGFTTATISLATTSTVNYNSNSPQTISNIPTYGNLTTTATGAVTKTATGALTVTGALTNGTNNTLADGGFIITVEGNCTMTGSETGTGKIMFAGGSAIHSVSGVGYNNVELNDVLGATQSAAMTIAGYLTIDSGTTWSDGQTLIVTGTTSINGTLSLTSTGAKTFGNLTINSVGLMSFSVASVIKMNGSLTVNGTGAISGTTGAWTFQESGGGTIGGTSIAGITTAGITFDSNYSVMIPYITKGATVASGMTLTNDSTMTLTALSGAGTFAQAANAILYINGSGNWSSIGAFNVSATGNDVYYGGAGNINLVSGTYYNLIDDKATGNDNCNEGGTTTVLGNLTVISGTGALTTQATHLTVNGTTSIYGMINDAGTLGTQNFDGAVTIYPGGIWGNSGEVSNFNFQNGLVNEGIFIGGSGLYTFLANNQVISGSSTISLQNIVVTRVQLTNTATAPLSIGTSITGTGEFIQGPNSLLEFGGTSMAVPLIATATPNTVEYDGSSVQTVQATTYDTLDVSENLAISTNIIASTTVNTSLILGGTILSTGSSTMIMTLGSTVSRTTGFVDGYLQKGYSPTQLSHTFQIGSGGTYAPVQLIFNTVMVPGNLTVDTMSGYDPNFVTSGLLASSSVERFYTVNNNGVDFDLYNATLTYSPTDVDASATPTNFVLAKLNSGTWSRPTLSTLTATSVAATGLTSFGDFQIGDPSVVTITGVSTTASNGTYSTGEVIDIAVQYSDAVMVAGGMPSLALNSGGTAFYTSGSGTNTLTFDYIVEPGDNSSDLDYTSTGALSLNGATIKDAGGGNVNNTLPPVGTFGSAYAIIINTTIPVFDTLTPTSTTAGGMSFTLTLDGSNFSTSSVAYLNGSPLTTTIASSGEVTAIVPALEIATAGTSTVTIVTPAPGGGTSAAQTFTILNPVPAVTSLSPTSTTAGSAGFIMTVEGTDFVTDSVVDFNGVAEATTFISSDEVTAMINASDVADVGAYPVTVANPTPGGGASNSQTFTVTPATNSVPTAISISPTSTVAGGSGFVLTMNGTNFIASSTIDLDSSPLATTFVSSSSMTATVTTPDIATAGTSSMTAVNPAPGGGTSNALTLTIDNPVPTTIDTLPTYVTAGSSGFTLTVDGTDFVPTSVVDWNGSPRAIAYVSSTQITAVVTASDVAAAGSSSITVVNPTPGGGASNAQTFTVSIIPNPAPSIMSISPTSTVAGESDFTLTVTGANFVGNSTLQWNGFDRATMFISSSTVTAVITATDIETAGTSSITVTNPSPGGGTSGSVGFMINPAPSGPGAIRFVFDNVTSSAVVGSDVTFNIEAINASGTVDTSFEQGVTLTVGGSGNSSGLVSIINGVGTSTVSDNVAETVLLGLEDSQSTGLNVGATENVTFVPSPVARFTLNHPGNMNTDTRLGYTVGREDQFDNLVSASGTIAYLYTNSTSTNAAFFNAAVSGAQIASTLISDGSTSTVFWYYDDTSGPRTVTASDNPAVPGGIGGITDASDTFLVVPGAVKFIFTNVPVSVTAGTGVTANVEAVDSSDNVIASFGGGVSVTVSGLAIGGGLVQIVNGVGTTTVTDATAETITLGLSDTQNTGLGVGTTTQIAFTPAPVTLPAPSTGGGSPSPLDFIPVNPDINITFAGMAYPGASVTLIRKDLGLAAAPVIQTTPVAGDGSFVMQLNNVIRLTGQTYLLSFVDKNGLIAQTKAYNVPVQEKLVLGNILAAPTLGFEGTSVISKGQPLVITGYGTPGATVELFIDGNPAGTILVNNPSGEYRYPITTDGVALGRHSIWALQKYATSAVEVSRYTDPLSEDELFINDATNGALLTQNASGTYTTFIPAKGQKNELGVLPVAVSPVYTKQAESDFSNQESFTISPLQDPKLDLNGDGVINIGDLSVFLSYLKNLNASITNFHITDPNIVKTLDFNGDGVVDVKDLDILEATVQHP